MQSRMSPHYYLSDEIFEREQRKIFRRLWIFAGLKMMVSENNAFIVRQAVGIPVVIQNFQGELHAFENVCLHRNAPLQTGFTGCRPLVCPYHAWRYDASGQVGNIPGCDAVYRFAESEKSGLKLREFALKAVGNLLFINLDPNPLPIEDQFSPEFLASLESSSNAYDTEIMVTTWHCKCNWKLFYENLRDFNHVRFVHPRSLALDADFSFGVDEASVQESLRPLPDATPAGLRREMRSFSYVGADGDIYDAPRFPWHKLLQRWGEHDAYFNWLAYPNLHIASADGCFVFTLENHIPITAGLTDIELYKFTSRKKQPFVYSSQLLLSHMQGSKQVLGEDVEILEGIQSVLHKGGPLPTQGGYEYTNRLIERWYTRLMETDVEV